MSDTTNHPRGRKSLVLAMALAVVSVGIGLLGFFFLTREEEPAPDLRFAWVRGEVIWRSSDPPLREEANEGDYLIPGQTIEVSADGFADVGFGNRGGIRISEGARVLVQEVEGTEGALEGARLRLEEGALFFRLANPGEGRRFEIEIPGGAVALWGAEGQVEVGENESRVRVRKGYATLETDMSSGEETAIGAGKAARVTEEGVGTVEELGGAERSALAVIDEIITTPFDFDGPWLNAHPNHHWSGIYEVRGKSILAWNHEEMSWTRTGNSLRLVFPDGGVEDLSIDPEEPSFLKGSNNRGAQVLWTRLNPGNGVQDFDFRGTWKITRNSDRSFTRAVIETKVHDLNGDLCDWSQEGGRIRVEFPNGGFEELRILNVRPQTLVGRNHENARVVWTRLSPAGSSKERQETPEGIWTIQHHTGWDSLLVIAEDGTYLTGGLGTGNWERDGERLLLNQEGANSDVGGDPDLPGILTGEAKGPNWTTGVWLSKLQSVSDPGAFDPRGTWRISHPRGNIGIRWVYSDRVVNQVNAMEGEWELEGELLRVNWSSGNIEELRRLSVDPEILIGKGDHGTRCWIRMNRF